MNSSGVRRIGPNQWKQLGWLTSAGLMFFLAAALFASAFGGLGWFRTSGWPFAAGAVAVFFIVFGLGSAIRGVPSVEIGPDGFVHRQLFGSQSRRWSEIEGEFAVIKPA